MTTMVNSDVATTADVNAELFFDPQVSTDDIHAEVTNGCATLSGVADTFSTMWAAEQAAFRVCGVYSIRNLIEVKPIEPDMPSDSDLAGSVRRALDWSVTVPSSRLQVLVLHGNVALSGSVDWYFQRAAAEAAVSEIRGVRSVKSQIIITSPTVSHTEITHDIKKALVRNAQLDARQITVDVEGNKVTLTGRVRSWAERNEAVNAAWRAKGVAEVVENMTIEF